MNPALSRALAIFLDELKTHLDWFEGTILPALQAGDESILERESKTLSHRLHQIRGGAGFLEFDELASRLKTCEELQKISAYAKLSRNLLTLIPFMRSEYERSKIS